MKHFYIESGFIRELTAEAVEQKLKTDEIYLCSSEHDLEQLKHEDKVYHRRIFTRRANAS